MQSQISEVAITDTKALAVLKEVAGQFNLPPEKVANVLLAEIVKMYLSKPMMAKMFVKSQLKKAGLL